MIYIYIPQVFLVLLFIDIFFPFRIPLNQDENTVEGLGIPASKANLILKESVSAPGTVPSTHTSPASFHANVSQQQSNERQVANKPADNYDSVSQPVTQNLVSPVTSKQLHVIQKPTRPTLVQSHPSDNTPKQLHVTQPPVRKPVSPTVAQNQIPDTTQQQLPVTQPRVRKPISPTVAQSQIPNTTQQQLPATQSSVTKPVSPTAAASYKVSEVPTKEQPTSAVPAQADVRDSPHRKRVRSRSRGRPVSENVADPAQVTSQPKRRREKSGSRKAKLEALEEDLGKFLFAFSYIIPLCLFI